jgi:hypothetical protein
MVGIFITAGSETSGEQLVGSPHTESAPEKVFLAILAPSFVTPIFKRWTMNSRTWYSVSPHKLERWGKTTYGALVVAVSICFLSTKENHSAYISGDTVLRSLGGSNVIKPRTIWQLKVVRWQAIMITE